MKGRSKNKKTLIVIGLLFIIGITCNKWMLAALLSRDAILDTTDRIIILTFNSILITIGIVGVSSKRSRALLITFDVIIVPLVLLELSLRLVDPIGISHYSEADRYFRNMVPDPDFSYIHAAGYHDKLQGVEVNINSEGLRGPEFQICKGAGKRRLLILGDSVVFGWGVPQNSILAAYLQTMLYSEHIECEVIAAGVGSWNTRAEYEFLKKRGVDYSPDVVLLIAVANDIAQTPAGCAYLSKDKRFPHSDARGHRKTSQAAITKTRELARSSFLARTVMHILRKKCASRQIPNSYKQDSQAWKNAKAAMLGIIDICRRKNIRLVVYLYGNKTSHYCKTFHCAYGSILGEQGVPYHVFPRDIFEQKYRNSIVDWHLNASGNRLMAEDIFRVLHPILAEFKSKNDAYEAGEMSREISVSSK